VLPWLLLALVAGSLVYCVGYRHPAVLANAICTIDQLSGGRFEFGVGAGWNDLEHSRGAAFRRGGPDATVEPHCVFC
jgi:alkanesulfonate monooxygenase SsuD/methylene tetrahydromethanopterin reductase-like flavin-dependent oxidoreductase (luciferase family)